ncbi:hypothetical protein [Spirosoma pomorum]
MEFVGRGHIGKTLVATTGQAGKRVSFSKQQRSRSLTRYVAELSLLVSVITNAKSVQAEVIFRLLHGADIG